MAQDEKSRSFAEFDARLRAARSRDSSSHGRSAGNAARTKVGAGLQVGIELVAGVVGGVLIGYALDRWLDTAPLLLIVFFFLGAAAGTLNAYRWLRRFSAGQAGRDEDG
jgi:ATP synthase protein I